MTPTIQSALLSAEIAKQASENTIVVLGGPHATFMDEEILSQESSVDIIVRGEGELTFLELIQNISNKKALQKVNGITLKKDDKILKTPNKSYIQNLDDLPRPAYEHFPLKEYQLFGRTILPIITSRGCPFQCSFCVTSRMFGKGYRMRSPKNIVNEMEWLRDKHGAEAFTFYDDTLTLDKSRLFKICKDIKNRNIGLPWDCQTRVDQVSRESLHLMKEAKCEQVFFGFESGCQEILNSVNKKTSVKQNENALRLAKQADLFVAVSIIIGYPGETKQMLSQSLEFIKKVKPDDVYLCVATPYPGTALRSLILNKGWTMSNNWELYDTINPVFENPNLSSGEIKKIRSSFYDSFYSPRYVLNHIFRTNFYSRVMARTAMNHIIWRIKNLLK
jgi:radical SAM superfamily enzyme YgiQ (UPF0313 family)